MKPAASVTALLIAAILPCVSRAQERPISVQLPGGKLVPVKVLGSLSSGDEKVGNTFAVQAAEDVVINGMVVVQRGAEGQGTVARVDSAGGNGHSGSLALTFDWIYSADGGKIRLSNGAQKESEEDRKGASSTATIIGVATLGIGGLFGHNFAHGKNVVVDGSKTLSAFVDHNVTVRTAERAGARNEYDR